MPLLASGDPIQFATRARRGLRDRFGIEASAVGRAPGRVNLIGEHTDYNGGLALPLALPHATYVAATARPDGRLRIASVQLNGEYDGDLEEIGPGRITGWATYAAGVVWALREAGVELPGLDLYVDSTVPLGAGLSSSAALECAVGAAAIGVLGRELTPDMREVVVGAGIRAEREIAGAPTGGMDQAASAFGVAGAALLIDFAADRRTVVPLGLRDRSLLVTDTRVHHDLADGGYGARRADCEKAAAELGVTALRGADLTAVATVADDVVRRRARHVVTEIGRVPETLEALDAADWPRLGELFAASHASMRDDFEISTPELDLAVHTAVAAGADAARMTGGGFGGSVVSVVPTTEVQRVAAAIDHVFGLAGYGAANHLIASPSDGASIMR